MSMPWSNPNDSAPCEENTLVLQVCTSCSFRRSTFSACALLLVQTFHLKACRLTPFLLLSFSTRVFEKVFSCHTRTQTSANVTRQKTQRLIEARMRRYFWEGILPLRRCWELSHLDIQQMWLDTKHHHVLWRSERPAIPITDGWLLTCMDLFSVRRFSTALHGSAQQF